MLCNVKTGISKEQRADFSYRYRRKLSCLHLMEESCLVAWKKIEKHTNAKKKRFIKTTKHLVDIGMGQKVHVPFFNVCQTN